MAYRPGRGGGRGRGVLGLIFAGYVPLASQSSYPIIVYSMANYRPHLSHFGANMQFSRSHLSHFYFYELNHFFYIEIRPQTASSLLFFFAKLLHAKPKHESVDPYIKHRGLQSHWMRSRTRRILREKADCKQSIMRPHYNQPSRKDATPSSGTSPLASNKEIPPHPPGLIERGLLHLKRACFGKWLILRTRNVTFEACLFW